MVNQNEALGSNCGNWPQRTAAGGLLLRKFVSSLEVSSFEQGADDGWGLSFMKAPRRRPVRCGEQQWHLGNACVTNSSGLIDEPLSSHLSITLQSNRTQYTSIIYPKCI